MQSQNASPDPCEVRTPYERSRSAVTDYYTSGEGATETEPFALLLFLRDQEAGATIQELCESRQNYTPDAKPYHRSRIRRKIYKAIERAQRHRLVTVSDRRYVLTVKGRQFVMGGIHSRAAMLKRLGLLHTIVEICALCTEDELAPSVQRETPPSSWPTEIGSSWLGAWLGTSTWPPPYLCQISE